MDQRRATGAPAQAAWGCLLLAALGAAAQPLILHGPVVDSITYSSARITWITDVPATTVIHYGRSSAYDATTTGAKAAVHSWFLSGLAPGTAYSFKVCSSTDGGEQCSGNYTLTTAPAPPAIPAPPEAPRRYVDTSMPAGEYGEPFLVNADCSNLPAILESIAQLEGESHYEILIPPRTVCSGQFVFPARPNHRGWILVRSTEEARLPYDPSALGAATSSMPVFRTDAVPAGYMLPVFLPASCSPGGLVAGAGAPGFPLFVCTPQGNSGGAKPIANANWSGTGPVVVTVGNHGYRTGNVVRIAGTGLPVDNLSWRITVIDEHNFSLDGSREGRTYSGGGTATRNDAWTQGPHTQGTTLPSSCTPNEWFVQTEGDSAGQAAFWCTAPNQWTQVRILNTSSGRRLAPIQVAPNASRYRFTGLEVTHIPTPDPPPPGWEQPDYRQGAFWVLVVTEPSNDRIIFDRCDIHGLAYPARLRYGLYLDGSNVALVNSRVHKVNQWTERADGVNMEAAAISIANGPGPGKIENNFLEAIGITIFFPDDSRHELPPADYEIRRNHFSHPDRYLYGSPWNVSGKNYMNRHLLELKTGQRMVLEGNLFDGNWADLNQGAMILLTPRTTTSSSAKTITRIENGLITVSSAQDPYLPGMLVHISNSGAANHDGLWEIGEVLDATTFQLKHPPSGRGDSGTIVAISSNRQISDLDIRNNIFRNGPQLLGIAGHASATLIQKTTQRIRLLNNLVYGMDSRPAAQGGRVSPIGIYAGGRNGVVVGAEQGLEDLIVHHNTIAEFRGLLPTLLTFVSTTQGAHAGLDVRHNIFIANPAVIARIGGSTYGTAALDRQWTWHPTPSWVTADNVFCCSVSAVVSGNTYADSQEQIDFDSNFGLKPSSPFKGDRPGGDPGVAIDALYQALPQWLWPLVPPYSPQPLAAHGGQAAGPRAR